MLVVGSGNVVLSLRELDWDHVEAAYDHARRFDAATLDVLAQDPGRAVSLQHHPDHRRCVPMAGHFLPLLHVAGLAAAAHRPFDLLVDGFEHGSLSMAAYTLAP